MTSSSTFPVTSAVFVFAIVLESIQGKCLRNGDTHFSRVICRNGTCARGLSVIDGECVVFLLLMALDRFLSVPPHTRRLTQSPSTF